MKKLFACILALLLVLLTPASANSAPTRQGSTDSSALEVDEGCPVTVTAEQLTFHVSEVEGETSLAAQVEAVYQMENPTEEPLSVQMSFYLEERSGHMSSLVDVDSAVRSITADGRELPFDVQKVDSDYTGAARYALTYTVDFPARGSREVAVSYLSSSYGLQEGTRYWTQEFTYLLSPARHWADFGALDITITAPEGYPCLIDASLPFEEAGERTYTAHFDGLPEGELTFTLYPKPSITLADRLYAAAHSYAFSFLLYLAGPLLLLAGAVALIAVLRRRRKRGGR